MQQVQVTMRVLSRPVESKLPDIYRKLGVDYDERVLPSIGNEVLKAVIVRLNMLSIWFLSQLGSIYAILFGSITSFVILRFLACCP